ncbi:hypothetical protein SAMN06265361_11127 [Laceyella tengchongensis]|uniref:Uncharacterized protein n=1 Tax=Laceyella tengchongensis TaxID=574699 RepID=A0AA45WS44_9BACL|nr:hypothetical protein [Laceyella tengchongensis]SMP34424.1 hypothetical protein SAMN06265361_11127 [Laceyella tengchongensis]
MAKKRVKEKRVAAVDEHGVLMRDLKSTALWIMISVGVVAVLALMERTLF